MIFIFQDEHQVRENQIFFVVNNKSENLKKKLNLTEENVISGLGQNVRMYQVGGRNNTAEYMTLSSLA